MSFDTSTADRAAGGARCLRDDPSASAPHKALSRRWRFPRRAFYVPLSRRLACAALCGSRSLLPVAALLHLLNDARLFVLMLGRLFAHPAPSGRNAPSTVATSPLSPRRLRGDPTDGARSTADASSRLTADDPAGRVTGTRTATTAARVRHVATPGPLTSGTTPPPFATVPGRRGAPPDGRAADCRVGRGGAEDKARP